LITAFRLAPQILWTVMVLGGTAFLTVCHGPRTQNVRASRDLPRNSLLQGDIEQPGFSGRYVTAPAGIKAGAVIGTGDVGDGPIPSLTSSTKLLFVIPVPNGSTLDKMQVGTKMVLCGRSQKPLGAVTAQYLRCERLGTNCSVTVELPIESATQQTLSAGFEGSDSLLSLRLVPLPHPSKELACSN
jgi:hypothetical protein